MADTYIKINSATVGAGGASSIDFTSIPSTYTDLVLKVSGRSSSVAGAVTIAFNGSSATFAGRYLQGNGTTVSSTTNTTQISTLSISTDTASVFGNFEIYIPNYADGANKSFLTQSVTENNLALAYTFLNATMWSTTSAINQITLTAAFAQYSTATLYGIKNS